MVAAGNLAKDVLLKLASTENSGFDRGFALVRCSETRAVHMKNGSDYDRKRIGATFYCFVEGNPLGRIDPTDEDWKDWWAVYERDADVRREKPSESVVLTSIPLFATLTPR